MADYIMYRHVKALWVMGGLVLSDIIYYFF